MATLIAERIENLDELESLRGIWNALLAHSETQTVELTYEWQLTYWRHFNQNAEIFVLVIRESGDIVAIAPLKQTLLSILGVKTRRLELIAAQESNYQDFVIGMNTNDVIECIVDYLVNHKKAWDVLYLMHVPEISPTSRFFLSKEFARYHFRRTRRIEKCAFLQIETSWDEYKKHLGKDRRHRMKNRITRIERDVGPIELKICLDSAEFNSALEEFFNLHRKRWDRTDTPSQFSDKSYRLCYSEAGIQLFSKGQIGLAILEAGRTTLAQLLYFTFDKTSLIQLIAYDPSYYPYSPMLVLQELFVEKFLADGIEIIDWGTYYPWKELWANKTKNRINLEIYPRRVLPDLLYLFSKLYEFIRISVKQNPYAANTAKFLRKKIKWLRKYSSQDDME